LLTNIQSFDPNLEKVRKPAKYRLPHFFCV
jgi:hypothetical protein